MSAKSTFHIGSRAVGNGHPVFIIAEAGVNHNGKLDLALALVDAAATAGADAVKFQTFKAEQVVTAQGTMADYQKRNSGKEESQIAMLRALELQEEFYGPLRARCRERGILFLSTPHGGFESVDFLTKLGVEAFKFGSGDLTNIPVITHAARVGIPMILGTGMATLAEVREAVRACHRVGNKNVVMLHCTTNYPCPSDEVDLRAMQTMMKELNCLVGYSDHTMGIQVPTMAATLGATVIEKHFTLDRAMEGPDHKASLEPAELAQMVAAIREAAVIMGSSEKKPHASEADVMVIARKSIVALREIKKGEVFTKENIGIKRPGSGLAPAQYSALLGRAAVRDITQDTVLTSQDMPLTMSGRIKQLIQQWRGRVSSAAKNSSDTDRFAAWKPPEIRDGEPTKWQWIVRHPEKFRMGTRVDIGSFTYIQAQEGVTLDDEVQIGSHCSIYSVSTIDDKRGPVHLKKNARVGSHSTIMPGVTIGENAIVGAHSFVKTDIPANMVAYGVPAKPVRPVS